MSQLDLFEDSTENKLENITDFFLSGVNRTDAWGAKEWEAGASGIDSVTSFPQLEQLFELSIDAFYAVIYARMSELPLEGEISRFIQKVHRAVEDLGSGTTEAREAAARAATDRGDPDVLAVLRAGRKVQHEIHRMEGLLRFSPGPDGVYIASCEPDHFILPALAGHFYLRFGETPWAIIDEKRGLCLSRQKGGAFQLTRIPSGAAACTPIESGETAASVEALWRLYHRCISNESRKNPQLQNQFMPKRYQKYLTELKKN